MPFVIRDKDGCISAIFKNASTGTNEFLPATHPEIASFMVEEGNGSILSEALVHEEDVRLSLQGSDTEIARVTEDLVHLLVKKNIILFTELPDRVQEKLILRENLRSKLNTSSHSIISDDETL